MENREIRKNILEITYKEDEKIPKKLVEREFLKSKLDIADNKLDSNILYLEEKGYMKLLKSLGSNFDFATITSSGKDLVENKNEFSEMFQPVNIIKNSKGIVIGNSSSVGNIQSTKINRSPGSKNVNISGNKNIVGMDETKEFNILTDNSFETSLLRFGRLIINLKPLSRYLVLGIPSLVSIFIVIDYIFFSFLTIYILSFPIFWVISLSSLFGLYRSRTCNKCGRKFAYEEFKPRKVIATGEYKQSKIYNIKKFFKCKFCGHEKESQLIEEF